MVYEWVLPEIAAFRISVSASGGEISGIGDDPSGKSVSFGNIPANLAYQYLVDGTDGTGGGGLAAGKFGVLPIFLSYLLGVSYSNTSAKKTLTFGVEEAE